MAYDNTSSARDQVSWNIAADQARHVSDLNKKAMGYYLSGDFGNQFWVLTGIRILINCELNVEERKKFKKKEYIIKRFLPHWEQYKSLKVSGQIVNGDCLRNKSMFKELTSRYHMHLMDFLKELGYLPNKDDRTKLAF